MSTAEAPTRSATLPCAPPFSHRLALEDGSARLSLRGEYDIAAEPRLASLLDRCTAGAALVIVDLSAVEFLSCGALHRLLTASWHTRAMGGRFVVVRGQASVQRLFDLVGVDLDLEIVDAPADRAALHRVPPGHDPYDHREEVTGRRYDDEAVEDLVEAERPGPRVWATECVHHGAGDVEQCS
jgi:anti-anti-sigma factor